MEKNGYSTLITVSDFCLVTDRPKGQIQKSLYYQSAGSPCAREKVLSAVPNARESFKSQDLTVATPSGHWTTQRRRRHSRHPKTNA